MKKTLILLAGYPGTGKTYMCNKILEQETAEAELKEQMEELRKTLETSEKKVVELNVINQENVSKAN